MSLRISHGSALRTIWSVQISGRSRVVKDHIET